VSTLDERGARKGSVRDGVKGQDDCKRAHLSFAALATFVSVGGAACTTIKVENDDGGLAPDGSLSMLPEGVVDEERHVVRDCLLARRETSTQSNV